MLLLHVLINLFLLLSCSFSQGLAACLLLTGLIWVSLQNPLHAEYVILSFRRARQATFHLLFMYRKPIALSFFVLVTTVSSFKGIEIYKVHHEAATNPCREVLEVMKSFYADHKYQYSPQVAESAKIEAEILYKSQPKEISWDKLSFKRLEDYCHVSLTEKRFIKDGYLPISTTAVINNESLITEFKERPGEEVTIKPIEAEKPILAEIAAEASEVSDVSQSIEENAVTKPTEVAEVNLNTNKIEAKEPPVAVQESNRTPASEDPEAVLFSCKTIGHRVVIDIWNNRLRYRSWNAQQRSSKPKLQLSKGRRVDNEASLCESDNFIFYNGVYHYTITTKDCSRWRLKAFKHGQKIADWLCLETLTK